MRSLTAATVQQPNGTSKKERHLCEKGVKSLLNAVATRAGDKLVSQWAPEGSESVDVVPAVPSDGSLRHIQ